MATLPNPVSTISCSSCLELQCVGGMDFTTLPAFQRSFKSCLCKPNLMFAGNSEKCIRAIQGDQLIVLSEDDEQHKCSNSQLRTMLTHVGTITQLSPTNPNAIRNLCSSSNGVDIPDSLRLQLASALGTPANPTTDPSTTIPSTTTASSDTDTGGDTSITSNSTSQLPNNALGEDGFIPTITTTTIHEQPTEFIDTFINSGTNGDPFNNTNHTSNENQDKPSPPVPILSIGAIVGIVICLLFILFCVGLVMYKRGKKAARNSINEIEKHQSGDNGRGGNGNSSSRKQSSTSALRSNRDSSSGSSDEELPSSSSNLQQPTSYIGSNNSSSSDIHPAIARGAIVASLAPLPPAYSTTPRPNEIPSASTTSSSSSSSSLFNSNMNYGGGGVFFSNPFDIINESRSSVVLGRQQQEEEEEEELPRFEIPLNPTCEPWECDEKR